MDTDAAAGRADDGHGSMSFLEWVIEKERNSVLFRIIVSALTIFVVMAVAWLMVFRAPVGCL